MKKNLNVIFFILIILILLIGISVPILLYYQKDDNETLNITYEFEIDGVSTNTADLIYYLLYYETDELDSVKLRSLLEHSQGEISEMITSNPFIFNFVNGILLEYYGQTDSAVDSFNACLETYDESKLYSVTESYIYGRCLYELGYICMQQNKLTEIASYYSKLEKILLDNNNIAGLIDYQCRLCADSYKMKNGIVYAVGVAESMLEYGESSNYQDMGYLYVTAANVYSINGNSVMFINHMMKALDVYQSEASIYKDNALGAYNVAFCLTTIGNGYVSEGNFEIGRKYLLEAYNYDLSNLTEESRAEILGYISQNLAILEIQAGNLTVARNYINEAKKYFLIEDESASAMDLIALKCTEAEWHTASGNYHYAIMLLDECLSAYNSTEHFDYINFDLSLYADYAHVYYNLGDYSNALAYYTKLRLNSEYRGLSDKSIYLEGLYKTYAARNDIENAMKYAEAYQKYLQEQQTVNQSTQAAYLEYQNSKQETEITDLQKKNFHMILISVISAVSLAFALAFVAVINYKNRQIKKISMEFERQSVIDSLTGLNNRRSMDKYLNTNWYDICSTMNGTCVAMIDIDFFKNYNDTYGHQKGDEVLQQISDIFKDNCNTENFFTARYGGEEFIIIINDASMQSSQEILEKIRKDVEALNIEHSTSLVSDHVTISLGGYFFSSSIESYEKAISKADTALYTAKETKNSLVFFQD